MNALIGEEAEADSQFWGQNAWQEEGSEVDDNFTESSSDKDVEDSDFDASEGEEDDGKEAEDNVKATEKKVGKQVFK